MKCVRKCVQCDQEENKGGNESRIGTNSAQLGLGLGLSLTICEYNNSKDEDVVCSLYKLPGRYSQIFRGDIWERVSKFKLLRS